LKLRDLGKTFINAIAARCGARVVNAQWGPRGVSDVLRRVRDRGFAPALVFDIGASNGVWTCECQKIFPASRYILVDPLEQNRDPLAAMAAANDRIHVWSGAVGALDGQAEVHEHGDQSSVLQCSEFPGARRMVEVQTADSLWNAHNRPAPLLLKADVQGYELEVLKGATRCLEATEILVLELSFRRLYADSALAHEIIGYVAERGFRIYELCTYLQRPSDLDLIQSDVVFVSETSPLFTYHGWK
jgi:FkbM family methyltransferase